MRFHQVLQTIALVLIAGVCTAYVPGTPPPSNPYYLLSAATTNATGGGGVLAGQHAVSSIVASGVNGTPYFLKFYNKATTPTCNSDTIVWAATIPANTSGAAENIMLPSGLLFTNGVAFCTTLNAASNDNTAISANSLISLGIQ